MKKIEGEKLKELGMLKKKKFLTLLLTSESADHVEDLNTSLELTLFLIKYSYILNDNATEEEILKRHFPSHGDISTENPNGARYLDPKYSRWISVDPALSYYVEGKSNRSSGGIYNFKNLNLYHYGNNNPLRYSDPNGLEVTADNENYEQPLTQTQKENVTNSIKNINENLDIVIGECKTFLNNHNPDRTFNAATKEAALNWLGINLIDDTSVKAFQKKVTSLKEKLNAYSFIYRPNKNNYAAVAAADKAAGIRKIKFGKKSAPQLANPTRNGNDVLEGIIVHEVSHFEIGTVDLKITVDDNEVKAYGTDLAGKVPRGDKINNADNWEYFYEKRFCNGL